MGERLVEGSRTQLKFYDRRIVNIWWTVVWAQARDLFILLNCLYKKVAFASNSVLTFLDAAITRRNHHFVSTSPGAPEILCGLQSEFGL